ncbi:MAG: amino acid adenylation domain-containing protein, partial [Acutalibacteraceae bacterium]
MQNVLEMLISKMKEIPDKVAFVDHGGSRNTTYGQLDELSSKIAAEIVKQGYKKGSIIPVRMPRCMEYIAAEIGIMKAGCVFTPLIMEYPQSRVDYILEICECEHCIDDAFVQKALQNEPLKDNVELDAEDGAYVIFTSGSTGNPKGIYHTQKSFSTFISGQIAVICFQQSDIYLDTIPHSFILSFLDYVSLCSGATIHILNSDERKDIHFVEDYIAEHEVTIAVVPPSQQKVFNNKSASLRLVISAGERLSGQFSTEYQIINCFGASETNGTFCFHVDKKYDNTPIGKPFPGVLAYVLDENGNPVPDGMEGELCISGSILSKGYLKLPEQTAKAFVPNPFSVSDDDKVLFHTNDVVKKLPDGNYIYLNRNDWLVKINGQRVETGEIEVQTAHVDGVETAVVKAFDNAYGQKYLVDYYKANRAVSAEVIRDFLKQRLPDYMIPSFFVPVDGFPLNANGKIDRKALMPPNVSDFKAEYAAPQSQTEKKICAAFEEILGCGKVGINDDFFALGGDSIKVMRLQNMCGMAGLSTAIIFEEKTPAKIAAVLENAGADIFAECQAEKKKLYPLTPSQMGVYLACVQNPNGTMYNTPASYTFGKDAGIDIDRLILSIQKAVDNHAALKLVIDSSTGTPLMKPKKALTLDIPVIKTDNLEQARKTFVQPFDIANGPLCRFAIFETETLYCLAMDFHHLVFDGTSASVICKEITLAYNGEEIPSEQLTQLDLAVYEEKLENTEAYAAAKAYYDGIFSGVDAKSEITADFKEDVAVENKPAAEFNIFVNDALSSANVEAFTHKIGVTPNTLFLGAYEYAVSKFTGQSETVVCTVDHGRHDSRMQNTVGMMVRTLPLYANIDEESTVADFLSSVQNNLQNTIKHDVYPFVKLSSDYDIAADIMLAYQSDAFNSFEIGGVNLKMIPIPVESSLAKLNIMIFKANGGFELRFEYRSDLYCEATIRSFADMYVKILGEFMTKAKLYAIEFLNNKQTSILDSFNMTTVKYDTSKTVVDLFREQVQKTPDHTAAVYLDKHYTYAELDEITERLAGYIHNQGIGREDVVSVLIPRCEYMAIASLGILKSGAAYQPLDPSYPPERLNFMIKDAAAKLLIADESLLELVPDYKGEVLLTKDIPTLPPCEKITERPQPEDLFIMLYTSGSTGIPKGAMLEHKNIAAFCHWYKNTFELTEESKVAAYASYGFDACMMDLYPALTSGAAVYIIDDEIRLNLVDINKYFEANGITHSFMTTQVGRQFVSEIDNHSLKYMLTGGERLVPIEPPKNFKFVNLYGPTECTVCITSQIVDKLYDRIPIGKALDNIKLYVIDKYGRRLPVGALGELCVAGNQVSRGYLNRPEQTEKVYTANPFCNEIGYERMYHTGDIVRCMSDGRIDFIGRNDGQVKIRGFRIELSEVEGVIREYEGITDATVVAQKLSTGGQCINAYIVADTKIDIEKLNDYIRSKKPPYMVPAATMQIDKIPLNVNGKVDKRKLPEIKAVSAKKEKSGSNERPLTFLEKKIVAVVAKIIGHEEFDISDDLLSIGMTSLSVIKLAVELNKTFGFEANVKKMMKGCSVLSIEDELQEFMLSGAAEKSKPQEEKKEYKSLYPLSKTQLGVYLDCMKNPYSTLYNIPSILTFSKSVNAQKLADSVKQVILAHPYVLTHLTIQNEDVEQVYVDKAAVDIPVLSMTETQLDSFKKDFVKPHSLMKSPLFRISVVETEQNIYLLIDFHHLVFDGASFNLFVNQLKTVYEGGTIESEKYTYYDYIENEIAAENGAEYQKAERFFEDMMKNFESASEITPDLSGLPENGQLAEAAVPIDRGQIEKFCSQNKITPAHLFLAATFYAVSRFTNSRNVYLSTISNGRSDMRVTNCFGMFVKTLPLGIEIEDISALDFVQKSKTVFTDTIENEIYPYAKICAKYSFAPNIVYEYQLGVVENLTIDGSEVRRDYLEMNTAKFKTAVHVEEHNGQPCVVVQYNDALYSADLMQTLAQSVACAAKHIIENPQGKIRKVSLLTDEQRQQIDSFATTLTAPIETKLLHKMFEKQAVQTPNRKALVACDRTLTYAELDRFANITANALIARGLQKGAKVVILLERTSKFFTTLIGILKAGGAFIPTCPEYPKERIDSIIEDSEAEFVVTEGDLLSVYDKTVDVNTLLAETNDSNPEVDVQPEDLAYLIYTSGSTGKPKGVMLRHIGIANYLTYSSANIQVKYVVDNCHNYGSVTTISFDMSLKETMLSLCHGLTLVFASDEQTVNPMALARFFKENDVDVFNATPSRLLQYMELDTFAKAMANCKVILSGGEKYPNKLLKILREKTNA